MFNARKLCSGNRPTSTRPCVSSVRSICANIRSPIMVYDVGRRHHSTSEEDGKGAFVCARMDYRRLPHLPYWLSGARRRHTTTQGYPEHAPSRHDRKASVVRRAPFSIPRMDYALAANRHLPNPPTPSSAPSPNRQPPVPVVGCNRARAILPTSPNGSTGRTGRGPVRRPRILRPHCPKTIIKTIRPMGPRPQIKNQHPHQ